jgi:hypothetical protein
MSSFDSGLQAVAPSRAGFPSSPKSGSRARSISLLLAFKDEQDSGVGNEIVKNFQLNTLFQESCSPLLVTGYIVPRQGKIKKGDGRLTANPSPVLGNARNTQINSART